MGLLSDTHTNGVTTIRLNPTSVIFSAPANSIGCCSQSWTYGWWAARSPPGCTRYSSEEEQCQQAPRQCHARHRMPALTARGVEYPRRCLNDGPAPQRRRPIRRCWSRSRRPCTAVIAVHAAAFAPVIVPRRASARHIRAACRPCVFSAPFDLRGPKYGARYATRRANSQHPETGDRRARAPAPGMPGADISSCASPNAIFL
jgi:hypothetical protein